jgi:hypothetical protein
MRQKKKNSIEGKFTDPQLNQRTSIHFDSPKRKLAIT